MIEITWTKTRRRLVLDLPVDAGTLEQLDRLLELDSGDWRSNEALLVLSEHLAQAVRRFAAQTRVPPTAHQLYMAARTICASNVTIPLKAIRDRETMREFLAANAPRGDLPASFVLAGRPLVEVSPQHPIVMKSLKAAHAIRTDRRSGNRNRVPVSPPTRKTVALKIRLSSN